MASWPFMDGRDSQGQGRGRRHHQARRRDPGIRLQEPHHHRPAARLHPPTAGDRRGGARRCAAARRLDRSQHTASADWADTAYRSKANEDHLADRGKRSRIHRRKPPGKPMPKRTARANARKSAVRTTVEPVLARQKQRMKLVVRSIGVKRAQATIGMANSACNLSRWRWWETGAAPV